MKKQTKLGLVLAAAAVISVSVASLVSAKGWVQNGADWYYVDNSGEYVTESMQSSGNSKFYLGEDGTMQRDFFLEDYNGNAYYFGSNGAMVTNTWVAVDASLVENQGDYVPDNYWYYFQASGKAMKAADGKTKKQTIDGKKYAFNQYGQMLTGWFGDDGIVVDDENVQNPFSTAVYYAGGDNDGILRAGWLSYYDGFDGDGYAAEYATLYFYFNTSNNKKYGAEGATLKKINGKSYVFDENGIMVSGWDAYDEGGDLRTAINSKIAYFSGEDDGHQVKRGWVYAVPSENIDSKAASEDEEKYMYFNASGEILKDQYKRINGKYYIFSDKGIMKTGIVLWAPNGYSSSDETKYVGTLDLDWATGEEISKAGLLRTGDGANEFIVVNQDNIVVDNTGKSTLTKGSTVVKLHNYGSDGARKTGLNNVEFADETFALNTTAAGDKGSGVMSKKYYSVGIQLKASAELKYGIYNTATQSDTPAEGEPLMPQTAKNKTGYAEQFKPYFENLDAGVYNVLNTSGSIVKGGSSAKKDADGNFWLINTSNELVGIWTVNVKANTAMSTIKTRAFTPKSATEQTKLDNLVAACDRGGSYYDTGVTIASLSSADSQLPTTHQLEDDTINFWFDLTAMEMSNPGSTGLVYTAGSEVSPSDNRDAIKDKDAYKWSVNKSNGKYYLTLKSSFNGYSFQSDINDQSSKYIPFGVLDNAKKTVCAQSARSNNDKNSTRYAYEVIPNNDYFLNCYWIKLN